MVDHSVDWQQMTFREAVSKDIPGMLLVRNSVKENILTEGNIIAADHCQQFLDQRGKGWVCEFEQSIVGFSMIDQQAGSVWALFVQPEFEKMGIGKRLHNLMLHWYFRQTKRRLWLTTEPGTRAEKFYKQSGWSEVGVLPNGELKFELLYENWRRSF